MSRDRGKWRLWTRDGLPPLSLPLYIYIYIFFFFQESCKRDVYRNLEIREASLSRRGRFYFSFERKKPAF